MRIVLAEDLYLLRDGMTYLLRAHDFEVVAAVGSGPELARAIEVHRPDLAVVDVRLPPGFKDEGLRVAIEARRAEPVLPVLVLSQHVEQLYARELLADGRGAVGYLLKDRVANAEQFIDAVRQVAAGGTVMDPDVVAKLVVSGSRDTRLGQLTEREHDVLRLMAEGRTNVAIAQRLHLSEGSVAKHINAIFAKLELARCDDDNRRVLAVLEYLRGIKDSA
jgi:DNA-binding NarL/FixJ family response regulator